MKTKDEIKKLFEKVDPEKETLLIMHIDEKDKFATHFCGDIDEITAGIATIIIDGFNDGAREDVDALANAIIDGVSFSVERPSLSAVKVMLRLIKSINKVKESIEADDDDDDAEEENCEDCENNRWCPLPDAVKYRKENHIPAPKKRKTGKCGKKGKNDK